MFRLCAALLSFCVLSDMLFSSYRNMGSFTSLFESKPAVAEKYVRGAAGQLARRSVTSERILLELHVGCDDTRENCGEIHESDFKLDHQELFPS
jgi:hypothetical protein